MAYSDEFPDFDPTTLPAIPPTWTDTSWHNDACPSFFTETGFTVFVDYQKAASREHPETKRFTVLATPDGQRGNAEFLLAETFSASLKEDLGERKFAEMKRRNETEPPFRSGGACASQSYCDANMTMSDAFEQVLGREPIFGEDGRDAKEDADIVLWNAAWEVARKRHIGHQG